MGAGCNYTNNLQDLCCDEHGWCGFCRKKRSDLGHLQNFRLCHLVDRCSAQTLGGPERRVPRRTWLTRILRAEALRSRPPRQFRLCHMADRCSAQSLGGTSWNSGISTISPRSANRGISIVFSTPVTVEPAQTARRERVVRTQRTTGGASKTCAVTNIWMCGFCGQRFSDLDYLHNLGLCHMADRCSAQTLRGPSWIPGITTIFSTICKPWLLYCLHPLWNQHNLDDEDIDHLVDVQKTVESQSSSETSGP